MLNFFMLAPHRLPLQLTPTEDGCQLSLHHANGVIMEHFSSVSSALSRAEQLNDLLSAPPRRTRRPRVQTRVRRRQRHRA